MTRSVLQPEGWLRPRGYANGIAATGRFVFTAGVVGWTAREEFEHRDLTGQFRQALLNTRAILAEGGAVPADIVRMTCYITNRNEYIEQRAGIGSAWRDVLGKVFPCMAVVEVAGLVELEAKVEIETTAIVSEER
jgi:enamine deaminase RidA (YjgF/YER057c/UK114 family)